MTMSSAYPHQNMPSLVKLHRISSTVKLHMSGKVTLACGYPLVVEMEVVLFPIFVSILLVERVASTNVVLSTPRLANAFLIVSCGESKPTEVDGTTDT